MPSEASQRFRSATQRRRVCGVGRGLALRVLRAWLPNSKMQTRSGTSRAGVAMSRCWIIDTRDEKIAEDAIRRHGQPAVAIRTASGKRHLLYRYNGESRRIRPWPDLPIDLLGDNGYALAAPSKLATGSYEIIHGHLNDLDCLKPMESGMVSPPQRHRGVLVPDGERNRALFDHCRHAPRHCGSLEALIDCAATYRENRLTKDPADPITHAVRVRS